VRNTFRHHSIASDPLCSSSRLILQSFTVKMLFKHAALFIIKLDTIFFFSLRTHRSFLRRRQALLEPRTGCGNPTRLSPFEKGADMFGIRSLIWGAGDEVVPLARLASTGCFCCRESPTEGKRRHGSCRHETRSRGIHAEQALPWETRTSQGVQQLFCNVCSPAAAA